jgi:CheY-like chemotaxis protein
MSAHRVTSFSTLAMPGWIDRSTASSRGPERRTHFPLDLRAFAAYEKRSGRGVGVSMGCRVLMVDDDVDSSLIMQMCLELHGHVVAIAHSGRAAMELVEAFGPELVLLETSLPDIDGYELADELRRRSGARSIQILAVTGWKHAGDVIRSLEHGFAAHLIKPIDVHALLAFLASAVRGAGEPALE